MSLLDQVKKEISQGFRCMLFAFVQVKGIWKVCNNLEVISA